MGVVLCLGLRQLKKQMQEQGGLRASVIADKAGESDRVRIRPFSAHLPRIVLCHLVPDRARDCCRACAWSRPCELSTCRENAHATGGLLQKTRQALAVRFRSHQSEKLALLCRW